MTNTNSPPAITDGTVTISWAPDGGSTTGRYFGYTTVAVVKARLALVTAMANNFTTSQSGIHPIGEAITWTSIDLQQLLNHMYVMPYTGSDANILGTLSDLNAQLALAWLAERIFLSNEPNLSPMVPVLRANVGAIITDLEDGRIVWYAPYGDATANPRAPVYDTSLGATIWPTPGAAADDLTQASWFTMGRTTYRRGSTM